MDVYYFVEAGLFIYRCSQSEDAWQKVDVSLSPETAIFLTPLNKVISKCLTDHHGCKYVVFDDHTGIRVFDPPNPPNVITIHGGGTKLLYPDDCHRLFAASDGFSETPIICA